MSVTNPILSFDSVPPLRFCLDAPALGDGVLRGERAVEVGLLGKVAEGEKKALGTLWERWGTPLFAIAYQALGNREDAEEALQDLLVKIWNKAGEYDPARSQAFSWAAMMLRGLILDRLRRRQRRVQFLSDPMLLEAPAPPVIPLETQEELRSALSVLTAEERRLLDAALFGPATHEGIAKEAGQPLGTVKSRIRLAIEKFRNALHSIRQS